jgi:HSP20 family molecular chaperone IbpA
VFVAVIEHGQFLQIDGKVPELDVKFIQKESTGAFSRIIPLPCKVEHKVEAHMENGILELKMKKLGATKVNLL